MSTLKEQFLNIIEGEMYSKLPRQVQMADKCDKLADQHAIGFAEWIMTNCKLSLDDNLWSYDSEHYSQEAETSELLEIYKKEQELNGLTK